MDQQNSLYNVFLLLYKWSMTKSIVDIVEYDVW